MKLKQVIKYASNPDLAFVRTDYPGNKIINGIYQNEDHYDHPSLLKKIQWKLSINPQRKKKRIDDSDVLVFPNKSFLRGADDVIVWLGHAAFFIRLNGIQILIDPCLLNIPFHKRTLGLPCEIEDFRNIDYILLSHGHRDHCDLPSLKRILKNNPQVEFLIPLGMSKILKPLGKIRIQEAGWYQQFNCKNIELTFLPAVHYSQRNFYDTDRTLWGSFFIRAGRETLYFAGDTGYGKHFNEIQRIMGRPDFCFMPIATYAPQYIMKSSHVNPLEAIKAFHDLGAKYFIPMHYGTYDLSDEPMSEPIQKIRSAFSSKRMTGILAELAIGEKLILNSNLRSSYINY